EVYVFTPKGDVKALPEGSTPIDFAYAVHTKVGEHCVGAKVNGKLVPLRYTLRQGDIVEIITAPSQHPSRDWLKIVKSTRARSKINQWLKVEERARSIELGRELFEREAKKYRLNPTALLGGEEIKKAAADLGYATGDDLLAALGYGKSSVHQLLNKLVPGALLEPAEPGKRPVKVAVYIGRDRPGLLAEITGAISSRNGNITKAEVTVTDDRRGINHFVIEVADLLQLQDIIGAIREIRDVINVERV